MKFKIIFKWFDIWIGFFIDQKKKCVYFFPIPMIGIVFTYGKVLKKIDKPQLPEDLMSFMSACTFAENKLLRKEASELCKKYF